MKKVLVFLFVLLLAVPAIAETIEFTVSVANGKSKVSLGMHADHIAVSCATAGIKFAARSAAYNSNGTFIDYVVSPVDPTLIGGTVPADKDTLYTILDTSVLVWNTYNDVPADVLTFLNGTGGAIDVTVKLKR